MPVEATDGLDLVAGNDFPDLRLVVVTPTEGKLPVR